MKGIVERLHRRLPGEHQIGLTELAADLGSRADREVFVPRLREPREPRSTKVRKLFPGARPEPNAPQLIRLVRTPYKMDTGYPRREKLFEPREPISKPEPLSTLLALEERPRISFKSPAESREVAVSPGRRLWREDA